MATDKKADGEYYLELAKVHALIDIARSLRVIKDRRVTKAGREVE